MASQHLIDRYYSLPLAAQNALITGVGASIELTRYGRQLSRLIREIEPLAEAPIEIAQQAGLKHLNLALERVRRAPSQYAGLGLPDINRVQGLADLTEFPLMDKETVRRWLAETEIGRSSRTSRTSGTTGKGLIFPTTREAINRQWATWWRYRNRHGIQRREWCAFFGAKRILPIDNFEPLPARIDQAGRRVIYSSQHLDQRTALPILEDIAQRGISWIHGFPSSISRLAELAKEVGFDHERLSVKWITLGAEQVHARANKGILDGLGRMPLQHYGMAEGVANISECQRGRLHIDEDFSFVELLSVGQNEYEIVGSNPWNWRTPFLRYRTGDRCTVESSSICECGRTGRIVTSLLGRDDDYIELADGRQARRLDNVFLGHVKIRRAQFFQTTRAAVTIRIECDPTWSSEDSEALAKTASQFLGGDMRISLARVDEIPPSSTGKHQLVIREIK